MESPDSVENIGDRPINENVEGSSSLLDDLILRSKAILSELETFRERLKTLRQQGNVEVSNFRGNVQSELSMLQRLSSKPLGHSTDHVARSSNLPFLEHVWDSAKQSNYLVALQKRIYVDSDSKALSQGMHATNVNGGERRKKKSKENAVIVDAITDRGRTWIKVSLVTNTRLLFDLAKQGWEVGISDDEDEGIGGQIEDEDRDVPLLRTVKELSKASKQFRARSQHPSIRIILPRIQPGETVEIDRILDGCRACGATVLCAPDIHPSPQLEQALHSMAPDPVQTFSTTLNIDCTILLALVSEFSHAAVSKEPWFHTALQRQVEIEDNENLLPSLLYPALGSHKLVCTDEAAKRMREIVETIGTASERARVAITMGDDSSKTCSALIDDLQQWSAYAVPRCLHLPIAVVDQNENDCHSRLPPVSSTIRDELTAINQSVFIHGWAAGRTTITSNRAVVKQIESILEKSHDLNDSVWPSMWLCPTARSLVGKEKRSPAKDPKDRVMPLPDPLHREEHRRNGLDVLSIREGHEVDDLLPNGHPCQEVLDAKNASRR